MSRLGAKAKVFLCGAKFKNGTAWARPMAAKVLLKPRRFAFHILNRREIFAKKLFRFNLASRRFRSYAIPS